MSDEKLNASKTVSDSTSVKEVRKSRSTKTKLYLIVFALLTFTLAPFIYGLSNGKLKISLGESENRDGNMEAQANVLRTEIAEISKQKLILEQQRVRILEQLKKTRTLVENSKNSQPEVDAHIQVVNDTCKTCRTPAWIESYREAFASLEEIEKILNENDSVARAEQ